jgi:hypothetical protein
LRFLPAVTSQTTSSFFRRDSSFRSGISLG